jgi:RNA polymerase sigma-70 factor (sigma-E family)
MAAEDEQDFHDFVVARWHPLLRTAFLLTGDRQDAEELVLSALVRVHRDWRRMERGDGAAVHARRVLVDLVASPWRHRLRVRRQTVESLPDLPATDAATSSEDRDLLVRACLELPPRMRTVLVLRYFEDLGEAETAATLGISVEAVRSRTSRALDDLRVSLDPPPVTDVTPTTNGSPA